MPTSKYKEPYVRVIPLGGIEEIGKNITVIETENDIIVIDCGLSFPQEDMLGIDLVIPDVTYLVKKKEKIRAFLITHGHEDHIGAIPFVLKQLGISVPIYATRFTLGMIALKLKEHRMTDTKLIDVKPGESVYLGEDFTVTFLNVNHSICGAVAMVIDTPAGRLIHTGDFKIDFTPIHGQAADLQGFAWAGSEGVLALFCDSTNAERAGYCMSERTVGATFDHYFAQAKGRIIVAMFASNVSRIQQVVNAAVQSDRYVVFNGRSMVNVANLALELGELKIPEGRIIDVDDVDFYDEDEIVIITTGSQGEELAGLTRMAFSEHRKLDIRESDMVIVSATSVPGNEKFVSRVINQLFRKGANVIYEALDDVHVSGHACQEELKIIHTLVKPRYFVPVHGEYKHLQSHKRLALSLGMEEESILQLKNGDVLQFTGDSAQVIGTVQAGAVLVDGLGVGDVGNVVLKDRKTLSQDGLMAVVFALSPDRSHIISGPDIMSRGFVYEKDHADLINEARELTQKVVEEQLALGRASDNALRNAVRDSLRSFMNHRIKRAPMIVPIVLDVEQEELQARP